MTDAPDDQMTLDQAAAELGVEPEQAQAMVDQELLVPTPDTEGEPRFTVAAVEAVRLAGA